MAETGLRGQRKGRALPRVAEQPVAAAMDRAGWPEVVGTVAGDDTVLVICSDTKRAAEVEARLRIMLES